ncbi:MAG: hypothetical protein H7Y60_09865 [Rhodospirillaceae bacterium]|nr:hypothetical protein [Rhodospirillales bacterium]
MMDILLILLLTLAGAVWRFIDGMSVETTGIATGLRNLVTIALAVTAAWIGGMGWWSPWAGGIAAASLMIGCTNWSNPTWQAIRFGGPAALAVLPLGMAGLPAIIAATMGGLSYPALMRLNLALPRFWLVDGWEAYARLVLGAGVIGGLALAAMR